VKSTRAQAALSVGVLQALRAVLIGFIPVALITLVAWAAGGSGNGRSADAIHGAGWIWLAAHHVGFSLKLPPGDVVGSLWLLPIGLSVIPWFVLRDSGRRIAASISVIHRRLTLIVFSTTYALSLMAAAQALATTAVTPEVWAALPAGFIFAFFSGANGIYGIKNLVSGLTGRLSRLGKSLLHGIAATSISLYGLSSVVLAGTIFSHWSHFTSLLTVLDTGWIGLALLIVLILASLPNAVIMVAAIVSGAGIAIGNHTLISPWQVDIKELPAFPLLAALPVGRSLTLTLLPIIAISASALGGFISARSVSGWGSKFRSVLLHTFCNVVILLTLNLFAGGALMGGQLSEVGASYSRILFFALPLLLLGSLAGGLASFIGSKGEVLLSER